MRQSFFCMRQSMMIEAEMAYSKGSNALSKTVSTLPGFKNNSYLESTLFSANEVSGLVQKQEGMGLSMGYQMAKVLKDEATGMKLMVVSGTTKEGDWKETRTSAVVSCPRSLR